MLMPKRVRYRKQMRGRRRGYSKGGTTVAFGEYGLKALDRGWITNRQIEAARVAMTRKIKRGGKVWINVMFELAGVPEDLAKDAMRLAGHKLPIKTKFVRREGTEQQS
jgi:large subunit ribosomal protein L16